MRTFFMLLLPLALGCVRQASLLPANQKVYEHHGPMNVTNAADGSSTNISTYAWVPASYDAQWGAPTVYGVDHNDTLFLTVLARAVGEGAEHAFGIKVQSSLSPYVGEVEAGVILPSDGSWVNVSLPFGLTSSYSAGNLTMYLNVGVGSKNSFEVKDVAMYNFGPSCAVSDLPVSGGFDSYEGEAPDAPWRRPAADRIREYRTSEVEVTVVDGEGAKVEDAEVVVTMVNPSFCFGTALSSEIWAGQDRDANFTKFYKEKYAENFNCAVIENGLKWPRWIIPEYQSLAIATIQDLTAMDKRVRGHNLVWPSAEHLPAFVAELVEAKNKSGVTEAIYDHLNNEVGYFANISTPNLLEWDVINEPFGNQDVQNLLGNISLAWWINRTAEISPNTQRIINDDAFCTGNLFDDHFDFYYNGLVPFLLQNNAQLSGLGCESHVTRSPAPISQMIDRMDKLVALNLSLRVTEFDIATHNLTFYANFLRDYLTITYANPGTERFLMWGFTDASSWIDSAPLFDKDFNPKPGYFEWRRLIFDEWWTNATQYTNASGIAFFEKGTAHHGNHSIQVETKSGQKTTSFVTISPSSTKFTIKI